MPALAAEGRFSGNSHAVPHFSAASKDLHPFAIAFGMIAGRNPAFRTLKSPASTFLAQAARLT
jgi:hypothetical protein